MMKSKLTICLIVVIAVLAGACSASQGVEPTDTPLTAEEVKLATPESTAELELGPILITDDLGYEIVLDKPAQKIISISPSLTEILFSVGAGDRLIGRDSNSNFPEAALSAADLGGMWDGIPVEELLALEPDLILAGEIFSSDAIAELRELGLTVFWQANPDSFQGLYENILDVSFLTGTEEQAGSLVKSLQERVAVVQEKLSDVEERPLVFYELDASDPANPWTPGAGTFISYVIEQAIGQNLGDSLPGEWVQISSEALVAQDPEIILLADALYGVTPESLGERAGWSGIDAIVNGQVYPFDPFILSVPGPRLVDGFEQLAEILHPGIDEER
jgi:iron complex transport system substrate-binding protein